MKRLIVAGLLILGGIVLLRPHNQTPVVSSGDAEFHHTGPATSIVVTEPANLAREPSPTTVDAVTTTTTADLANTDRLERTNALVQHLPRSTSHYSIDYSVGADGTLNLKVTLLAVLNSPSQVDAYRASLKAYKNEALAWIASQGAAPNTYRVTWLPPEAEGL